MKKTIGRLAAGLSNTADRRLLLTALSGGLIALAALARWGFGSTGVWAALMVVAAVVAGSDIALRAWHALRARSFSIELLVTIAAGGTGGHIFPALALADEVYLPANPERAALLDGRGIILTHMARFDAAEKAIGEAISILDVLYPDGLDPSVAAAYNNMALALDNAERDREAEPYMLRACDLAEKLFGRSDPRYAISVANLGNLYRQMGRHEEADKLLAEGLQLRRELLGDAHPFVGHGLVQVARLRLLQGRAADAQKLADQASDIYAKADYKDPRRLASTDEVRARAMAALGQVPEAVELFEHAIAQAREAGVDDGVEWPRVMAARAELFLAHLPLRAPAALADALDAHRRIYGDDHPGTKRMVALAAAIR